MEKSPSKTQPKILSLNILVPVVGLVYFVLFFTVLGLVSVVTTGTLPVFIYFNIPVMVVNLLAAIGVWRRLRAGYIASIVMTGLVLILFNLVNWEHGLGVLANPANTVEFLLIVTSFPLFIAAFVHSISGLRDLRSKPWDTVKRTQVARFIGGGGVALLALGFIIGGLTVGLMAGATQSRLLGSSGSQADITIVSGAGSQTNGQFYVPATFTVKASTTATWVNRDATAHTVTSTNGVFDSGNMDSGAVYRFTFAQPGTYQYTCSYHPWMKGTIVVVSG